MIDINKIRSDFPLLSRQVYGKPLVYFDNGATTQKPRVVIDAIDEVYLNYNANVHRGVHAMSDQASEAYESARDSVRSFINAGKKEEIIFTAGTTASINTVAFSFSEAFISKGDEIIVSELEHHANIVPWQMMCERKGAVLKVIPFDDSGQLIYDEYLKLLNKRTKLVAVAQVSNALGTILPVKRIIADAHQAGAKVLVDGAQGVQHGMTDVHDMDCDFYVFSGHKIYGPTGIGVLYGKEELLDKMPPYQGGGDMVERVTFARTTYNKLPFRFEAGTMNYPGAIGLAKALDYVSGIGRDEIVAAEKELLDYATETLGAIPGIRIFGTSRQKVSTISFLVGEIHQYDTGMILDKMGVAVRTGTHCAQPVMDHFGIDGTVRASMCFYNTKNEVDLLARGIEKVIEMFS
ncbi:MAG: cysteine desulfurase [Bacteroidales bacterium]